MNKMMFLPAILSVVTMALTGCGEGEDAIFGNSDGNNSNELTIYSFANSYDNQANAIAIARINETYRTGSRKVITENIINSYDNRITNDLDQVVLGDKFAGRLENNNIEVNRLTIKRPIYENNSNRKLRFETTYRTLNLAGVKATSYNAGNTIDDRRGIITDLNNYPKISATVEFPVGSTCYIPVVTSEQNLLAFNAKNETNYRTLNDWVRATENRFGNNGKPIRTSSLVGNTNQYKVEQIKFNALNNQPEYLYNGLDYNNKIYEADFISNGTDSPNENSLRGVVDCTLVNKVASDFIEREVRRAY